MAPKTTAKEMRDQELALCQAKIQKALDEHGAALTAQRVANVGSDGIERVTYQIAVVPR